MKKKVLLARVRHAKTVLSYLDSLAHSSCTNIFSVFGTQKGDRKKKPKNFSQKNIFVTKSWFFNFSGSVGAHALRQLWPYGSESKNILSKDAPLVGDKNIRVWLKSEIFAIFAWLCYYKNFFFRIATGP